MQCKPGYPISIKNDGILFPEQAAQTRVPSWFSKPIITL